LALNVPICDAERLFQSTGLVVNDSSNAVWPLLLNHVKCRCTILRQALTAILCVHCRDSESTFVVEMGILCGEVGLNVS